MDRKNMALILSIFLFVGLLFSVDPLERERDYNYGETHQIYSAGAGLTSGVSAIKTVRRIQTGSSLAADGWEKTKRAAIRNSVINLLQKKRIGDK